jgi:hypothetical protein
VLRAVPVVNVCDGTPLQLGVSPLLTTPADRAFMYASGGRSVVALSTPSVGSTYPSPVSCATTVSTAVAGLVPVLTFTRVSVSNSTASARVDAGGRTLQTAPLATAEVAAAFPPSGALGLTSRFDTLAAQADVPPSLTGLSVSVSNRRPVDLCRATPAPAITLPRDATIILQTGTAGYGNNWACEQLVSAAPGHTLTARVISFASEATYDFLYLYDGTTATARLMTQLSGVSYNLITSPLNGTTLGNSLFLRFRSDGANTNNGAVLAVTARMNATYGNFSATPSRRPSASATPTPSTSPSALASASPTSTPAATVVDSSASQTTAPESSPSASTTPATLSSGSPTPTPAATSVVDASVSQTPAPPSSSDTGTPTATASLSTGSSPSQTPTSEPSPSTTPSAPSSRTPSPTSSGSPTPSSDVWRNGLGVSAAGGSSMVFGLNASQGLALFVALLVALALALAYFVRLHVLSRKRRALTAEPRPETPAPSSDSTVNPLHRLSQKSAVEKVWFMRSEGEDVWYDDGAGAMVWTLPEGAVACNVETSAGATDTTTANPMHRHAAGGQRAAAANTGNVWHRRSQGDDVWYDNGTTLVWSLPEGGTVVDDTPCTT